MADNYLEKKFEEHLNAPYKPAHRKPSPTKQRRIVVTGGASGLGRFIVKALRVAAHKVAFCDADDEAGREIALSTGADFFHVDVTDAQALRSFFRQIDEKWGGVDAVVNNATSVPKAELLSVTPEQFDAAMAQSVRPIIIGAQEIARMRSAIVGPPTYGRIVNICSPWQGSGETPGEVQSAANGAIVSLTRSLAVSLSQWGIAVNSISPGKILAPTVTIDFVGEYPLSGRVGRPDDVTRVLRFLLDDGSDFIDGQNFNIDGGMTIKMTSN